MQSFRKNIKTTNDDQIREEKLQYEINRELMKISALLSD